MHDYYFDVVRVIQHYKLESIVYCERDINFDLVSEFYNNLHPNSDGLKYRTCVARRDLDFTPAILQEFLGCLASSNGCVFYPSLPEVSPTPFEHISLSSMHEYFYHQHRPDGSTLFSTNEVAAVTHAYLV